LWKEYGYIGIWAPLLAGIAVVAYWQWDKLVTWWNKPADEFDDEE
jgi:hypothetical protein